jgi:hypothetical protein
LKFKKWLGEWSGLNAAVMIGIGIILVWVSGPPDRGGVFGDPWLILYGAIVMLAGLVIGFIGERYQ